ncbi:MAG: MBL fold metallo-hydrolase [bacterium]|nr:MBL fold metallo-hydrolase [bacterium]
MSYQVKIHKIDTPYIVGPVDIFELWGHGKHILVDTGPQTKEAQRYLKENIDLASLDYLLLTHCHPDHYGLAHFIGEHSQAEILMAQIDAQLRELFSQRMDFLKSAFKQMGFPKPMLMLFDRIIPKFQGDIPFPKNFGILEESEQVLADLGITFMGCPGHSQSDIVYLFDQHAITGDCLLRNIFSAPLLDMDLRAEAGRFSNYQAYCASIKNFKSLEGRHIYPSHNDWIEGIDQQILFYCQKITSRAAKIEPLFGQRKNHYQTLKALFPDLFTSPFKLYIKAGELCFLEDYLEEPERLHQALAEVGLLKQLDP